MADVTRLQQPFRKRLWAAWDKLRPKDGAGFIAFILVVVAMVEELRDHTDKATYMLCLAIVLLLLSQREPH